MQIVTMLAAVSMASFTAPDLTKLEPGRVRKLEPEKIAWVTDGKATLPIGNVLVKNVRFREAGHGLLVQTCYPEAPAHAGVTIDGVVFEDIEIDDSAHPILVTAGTKDAEKALANVVFRNIRAKAVGSIVVEGAGRTRPMDIRSENVDLTLVPRTRPRAETRDWEVVGQSNTNGAAVCVEQADGVVFRAMRIRRDAGYLGPYDMKGRDVDYSVLDASVDREARHCSLISAGDLGVENRCRVDQLLPTTTTSNCN